MTQQPIRLELPTVFGMKTVNTYLFKEPEPILIDCGENTEASWKALNKGLEANGLTIKDIEKVIITHAHVDHIGMAKRVAEASEAKIWVSEVVYDWAWNLKVKWEERGNLFYEMLQQVEDPQTGYNPLAKLFAFFKNVTNQWEAIPKEYLETFPIDGTLEMGGQTWEVIYAPGHSNTQTCFYQAENRQLLSADMLLRLTPTPVLDTDLEDNTKRDRSLPKLLKSYELFYNMDIDWVYPGHYLPFNNHKEVITAQVNRIHARKEECFELIKNGKHHFFELFNTIYAKRQSMPALSMLVGYLDLLEGEGKIEERLHEGRKAYFEL